MEFSSIFGPARIDTGANGAESTIKLKPRSGGRRCKNVQYSVKTLQSSGANVRLTVSLDHGPDGTVMATHSTAINAGDPTTTLPSVLVGDVDSSKVINEYLQPLLKIKDSALTTAQWAVVEVFEMRKPF